jgi:plastocyanin/mono/diheme cytochrome c family protein
VGAVQRLATVVIIGLVALSTVLVLYTADENNRVDKQAEVQQDAAIERGTANFIQFCMACHGPAGEGLMENVNPKRLGLPLGGDTYATKLNQEGIQADGTPYPGGFAGRTEYLTKTIHNGKGTIMPAWGQENGGQLNDQQIIELVIMIQHVDWNKVYNTAIETAGGYPTVPPPPAAETAVASAGGTQAASDGGSSASGVPASGLTLTMHDISFDPTTLTIPSNTAVTIHVVNEGAALHNFSMPDQGVSVDVEPGQSADVEIPALPAGDYNFDCDVPGHKEAGMVGTLTASDSATLPEGAASAASPPPASGTPAGPAEGTETSGGGQAASGLTLEAVDIAFKPTELTVKADTPTTVTITNTGAALHNFSVAELGVSVDIQPGETQTVEINAPAGSYQFYCDVPGHKEAGMVGTLTSQ